MIFPGRYLNNYQILQWPAKGWYAGFCMELVNWSESVCISWLAKYTVQTFKRWDRSEKLKLFNTHCCPGSLIRTWRGLARPVWHYHQFSPSGDIEQAEGPACLSVHKFYWPIFFLLSFNKVQWERWGVVTGPSILRPPVKSEVDLIN